RVRDASRWAPLKEDDFPPRATRFRMSLPLRYRSSESDAWLDGTTENISATGVLFLVEHLTAPGTSIEMSLLMPKEILRRFTSRVTCRGHIVQTVASAEIGRSAMAATIEHYRFARGEETASVLHLISSAGFYGAENALVLLARTLQRRGCRSIVGVFSDS